MLNPQVLERVGRQLAHQQTGYDNNKQGDNKGLA